VHQILGKFEGGPHLHEEEHVLGSAPRVGHPRLGGERLPWGASGPALPGKGSSCPTLLRSAQPHLQHWVQVWVPLHKMDIKLFESLVAGNREGEGSEGTVCEEWLRPLGVLSPEQKS